MKFKDAPLWIVTLISCGIALFEYCCQVPAHRIGHGPCSAAERTTMQEVIMLTVFAGFSVWYLGEPLHWKHGAGFALIGAGACGIFHQW